jgi:hypothetical protein
MIRTLLLLFFSAAFFPAVYAAPRLHAFLVPDRTAAILLIGALFYCGFKWRTR